VVRCACESQPKHAAVSAVAFAIVDTGGLLARSIALVIASNASIAATRNAGAEMPAF
jgi:hypothetical protein